MGHEIFDRLHPGGWRPRQEEAVRATLTSGESTVWVAEVAGRVVGFVSAALDPERRLGEVSMLAVDPDHQQGGIGTALGQIAALRNAPVLSARMGLMGGVLPEDVRRAALFPSTNLPDFPPGHPTEIRVVGGVAMQTSEGLPMALVHVERVDDVERTVAAVRLTTREQGRKDAVWVVPESAQPSGLAQRLRSLGLKPNERPPFEPRGASMAIAEPPPQGSVDVVARQVETFDEFLAATDVSAEAFGMDDEMRAASLERAKRAWPFQQGDGLATTFIATIRGEAVGFATAMFGPHAAFLSGGGTRPAFRGAGVYRALIRARWDAAVARGTPALTVGAGRMSRPALERLGFEIVGWYDVLVDDSRSEPQPASAARA